MIYRPETELASHYFQAVLPEQFDEYIWFDDHAVTPFKTAELEGCRIPIHSVCDRFMAATAGIQYRPREDRLDANGAFLAKRTALSLDRRFWRHPAGVPRRGLAEATFLDGRRRLVGKSIGCLAGERGIRIGEESDRDGQYFHYLAMWLYALAVIGRNLPAIPR